MAVFHLREITLGKFDAVSKASRRCRKVFLHHDIREDRIGSTDHLGLY